MLEQIEHKFSYDWTLKNAKFTKDKGTVFSCFACGGGSSMGYKLAGFDVVGCNEIDRRVMDLYVKNHHPRYAFLEPIQTFKERTAFPDVLYNLDILDGSPPCSTFSMVGSREESWGKMKKFREGQAEQVLDTLFFDFIDVVRKLRPKVVIAENVKGLLQGAARKYVQPIHMEFEDAGYSCQHFLLDAQYMGVPQHRERVFFVCLRNDLMQYVPTAHTLFDTYPVIKQKTKMKISKWRITAFVGWIVATLIVVSATMRGISKADTATNLISAAALLAWVLLSLATNCFTFKNNKNEKN